MGQARRFDRPLLASDLPPETNIVRVGGHVSKVPPQGDKRRAQAAFAFSRRYSVGVTPVVALKARLKGPSDWKPASIAMVITGTSACEGSARAALASSIRWLLRKTLKLR